MTFHCKLLLFFFLPNKKTHFAQGRGGGKEKKKEKEIEKRKK